MYACLYVDPIYSVTRTAALHSTPTSPTSASPSGARSPGTARNFFHLSIYLSIYKYIYVCINIAPPPCTLLRLARRVLLPRNDLPIDLSICLCICICI